MCVCVFPKVDRVEILGHIFKFTIEISILFIFVSRVLYKQQKFSDLLKPPTWESLPFENQLRAVKRALSSEQREITVKNEVEVPIPELFILLGVQWGKLPVNRLVTVYLPVLLKAHWEVLKRFLFRISSSLFLTYV